MNTNTVNTGIKTDMIDLVNNKNAKRKALETRENRAQAYSTKVQRKRKREIFSKVRCFLLYAILLGGTFTALATAYARDYGTDRKETAVLVDIEDGNYILQTEDGHKWKIQDGEEIYFNVEFNNNGTDKVEDDEITGIELVR